LRYATLVGTRINAEVAGRWLLAHGKITESARALLEDAATRLGLSARGYHRSLRVARTIADLDGSDAVSDSAIAESLRYRAAPRG
jgi:magnesium chelatase family protein